VILAALCAIYVRRAVRSRPGGRTATATTNGKASPSKERPYWRPHAREEHRVAISDYLIASLFHSLHEIERLNDSDFPYLN
jgi:hypothetical protein